MSNYITYEDKVGIIPKTNHVNQWWDDDANELKDNHNLNDDRVTVLEGLTGSAIPDGIKSGGIVSWESGLVFNTSYCEYVIGGVLYSSEYTQSTLSAADVTNPRFDIIVVDTSGDVTVITGTAAADPQKPVADPQTQIELTSVLVAAGATEPSNVTEVLVYDEDVEWTASESGATVDFASTTNVYSGSVSTDITVIVPTDYIKFVASSPVSTAWGTLSLFLAKKVANSKGFLYVQFLLSGVRVADTQVIDLRDSNTTSYVNIAIDLLVANFTSLTMDEIRFVYNDAGPSQGSRTGFYIDYIKLQDGITQPEIPGILNLYVDSVSVESNISKLDLIGSPQIDLSYSSGGRVTIKTGATVQTLGTTGAVTMDASLGLKGDIAALTGNTVVTITNLLDGQEGSVEVVNGSSAYTFELAGSTGYTTEVIMGTNATIDATISSHTTVIYWRSGSTLYYGYLYDN